jgi:hypothetical protein
MSLQGATTLLHTAPRQAHHILETCIEGLNRSIAQLRAHIAAPRERGTPARLPRRRPAVTLLRELRPARGGVNYDFRHDPLLAAALPQDSIAQLLFIAPKRSQLPAPQSGPPDRPLVLGTVGSEPTFTIEDDGCGFDPEPPPPTAATGSTT